MNINNDVKYVLINEEELQKRIKELAKIPDYKKEGAE